MQTYRRTRRPDGGWQVEVPLRGAQLLAHPMFNKSSAFTEEERRAFGLDGLLPAAVSTQEMQAERVYENITRKSDPLEQYIGLQALQDRNEHLYYRLLLEHLEEFLPVVYTPTVGRASKEYSHIFRRGRGLWITPAHRGRIAEVLDCAPFDGVRLIVATDNQAILGIGDQGAGGMAIPIGKLAIYSAAAGIHPAETLPVSLDVGTDNRTLLDDELYLGWRQPRLTGAAYEELMDEFVEAVGGRFPGALLQWEDFQKANAFELLARHRDRIPSFNDDIQGTGAVALAGLLAAMRLSGAEMREQRVAIVGGGAAGVGIARQLSAAFAAAGLEGDELTRSVAVLDSRGLLTDDRDRLDPYKTEQAWPATLATASGLGERRDLAAVVAALRPTALIGTSGQAGLFDEELVREMARHVERPAIFPFSNPTDHSEAEPRDLLEWTDGRALIAAGSPFAPVRHGDRTLRIGQGNNAFIFPGIGLGALTSGARWISDAAFTAAAEALAGALTDEEMGSGLLFPAIDRLREVTREVASAVGRQAIAEEQGPPHAEEDVSARVAAAMWSPDYPEIVPV
jgi:malate dehydrogenase (oxaloacetate-decarboxylating)